MTDVKTILTAVLKENAVNMSESQVDMMVANTFKEHDVSIFVFILWIVIVINEYLVIRIRVKGTND